MLNAKKQHSILSMFSAKKCEKLYLFMGRTDKKANYSVDSGDFPGCGVLMRKGVYSQQGQGIRNVHTLRFFC
jgi:hypothetical protein